jgi:hypothetical protein
MIAALDRFDKITAAGILARAALAVEDEGNPAASTKLPGEEYLRRSLVEELRRRLQIKPDDHSVKTLERLGEALDNECDALLEPTDTESALKRLAEKGDLPSDLYELDIISSIADFHGKKFENEKRLIELTVHAPEHEQHYGPPANPNDPFMISLFAKFFPDQYSLRSFTMLVAGQRQGLVLHVHQAWRVYPSLVNLDGVDDLVTMLRRFSDAFGADIEIGGQKGPFILAANLPTGVPVETSLTFVDPAGPGKQPQKRLLTVSSFVQPSPRDGQNQIALATGIDLSRYREAIKERGW